MNNDKKALPMERIRFDFIGRRKLFLTISAVIIGVGLIFNIIFGTELDINFKGGTIFIYSYTSAITEEQVKTVAQEILGQSVSVDFTSDITGTTDNFTITLVNSLAPAFTYTYSGTVDADVIQSVAAEQLSDDVTVEMKDDSSFIITPSKTSAVPEATQTAMTTALTEKYPNASLSLTSSNSVTDVEKQMTAALVKAYGTQLVYTYTGSPDSSALTTLATNSLGEEATATLSNGTMTVVPSNAAASITSSQQEALTAALQGDSYSSNSFVLTSERYNAIDSVTSSSVKPSVGRGFFIKCIVAIVLAAIFLTIYVGLRFRKIGGLSAGVFATLALLHDIIIAYLVYVVFRIPLDDNFIAVVLTLLGYSLNDTIVIYDRIRENERMYGRSNSVPDIVNLSVNQTFKRNIMTAFTTVSVLVVICIVAALNGITSIMSFAFPITVGMIAGCYSSVLLSSPLWSLWREHKLEKDKLKAAQERSKTNTASKKKS